MTSVEQEWRENLKPGDVVIYHPAGFYGQPSIERVERVTKTQIVVKGICGRFRKRDGHKMGESYSFGGRSSISMPHDDEIAKIRRDELARKVDRLVKKQIDTLTMEQLEAIEKVIAGDD